MLKSLAFSILCLVSGGFAPHSAHREVTLPGLSGRWVFIIRHGEKPEEGTGLTPAGEARAKAYVSYFQHFTIDSKPISIARLIATKDSKNSYRERLTLEPLSAATHIKLEMGFKNAQFAELVDSLGAQPEPGNVLICWHHGNIPGMITSFGADPNALLPGGKWPSDHFDYVIELHYDANGHLIKKDTAKIEEPKF